jgi:hypothetical protein
VRNEGCGLFLSRTVCLIGPFQRLVQVGLEANLEDGLKVGLEDGLDVGLDVDSEK